jgi:hypothetical protein
VQRRFRAVSAHDERTGARGHDDDLVIDRGRLHSVGVLVPFVWVAPGLKDILLGVFK